MNTEIESVRVSDVVSIRRILQDSKTIAVVGLSAKWHRPSYFAAKYMLEHGYEIVPVNPNYDEILGRKCFPRIEDIPFDIDVVDVFQRSEVVEPIAESAVRAGAKVLWLQIGVENEAAGVVACNAGMDVVMDRCMKIEHARIFGGLNFIGVDTSIISSSRPTWLP